MNQAPSAPTRTHAASKARSLRTMLMAVGKVELERLNLPTTAAEDSELSSCASSPVAASHSVEDHGLLLSSVRRVSIQPHPLCNHAHCVTPIPFSCSLSISSVIHSARREREHAEEKTKKAGERCVCTKGREEEGGTRRGLYREREGCGGFSSGDRSQVLRVECIETVRETVLAVVYACEGSHYGE